MKIPPQWLKTIQHLAMLALLGAASVSIMPLYDVLSHSTTSLPVQYQELLTFLLPVVYASVVKLKDEVDAELQAEQNTLLVNQNQSLAKLVEVQQKSSMGILPDSQEAKDLNAKMTIIKTLSNPPASGAS